MLKKIELDVIIKKKIEENTSQYNKISNKNHIYLPKWIENRWIYER